MHTKDTEIFLLEAAIQQMYRCEAVHLRSAFVDQKYQGKTIWMGYVEIFALIGHPKATACYAWLHQDEGQSVRPVLMLDRWPVNSPETAVAAAITFDIPKRSVGFDLAKAEAA